MTKRTIAALIILASGVSASTYLFVRSPIPAPSGNTSYLTKEGESYSSSLKFERTARQVAQQPTSNNVVVEGKMTANLTENMIGMYLDELSKRNGGMLRQDAKNGGLQLKTIPKDLAANILENGIPTEVPFVRFTEKDVRVLKDSTSDSEFAYLTAYDQLLHKHFAPLKGKTIFTGIKELSTKGTSSVLQQLVVIIPAFINELRIVSVPATLTATHLEALNLWQKKLATYKALINSVEDPLRAYIAAQNIPEIVEEDILLQAVLIRHYNAVAS